MSWLRFLNDIEIINDEIKKNWESLEELSQPFREYTGEMNSLEYLKIFINDADKLRHLEEPGYYKKVYLDFWDHYYNTPQQDAYGSLIQKLKEDRTYLPEFEDEDYGVWTTRAYNALAQRAYKKINTSNVVKFEKYNFQSFIQPHGYDAVDLSFDIIPNSTGSSYTLDGILDFFDPNPDLEWDYSQEIKEHPLFKVGEIIRKIKVPMMAMHI